MLIKIPEIWIVIIDIAAWFIIHMGVAYLITSLPGRYFSPRGGIHEVFFWEKNGLIYDKLFKVKKWKDFLPDGAALFKKGIRKKKLGNTNIQNFNIFMVETCRGEITHLLVIFISPVFFLWNYCWAGWVMIIYAIIVNTPCIIVQRYNRARLVSVIQRMENISGLK